ncbi:MAG: NAD(P)-binding domain-containing protein [Desulfobacterales bacterium]|nr:NAD(P)-binding domain-containing protein [Desulfobacterales bacterium]
MSKLNIGILHPGQMGISIAASAQNTGHTVYWASEGRSRHTLARAEKFNLLDTYNLKKLCETCSFIISVCPPHAAEDVANNVSSCGFNGFYIDANAISPQRAIRIGQKMAAAGISFVDGGIIGPPAWNPGKTWIYLSGNDASVVASCFSAGPLETVVMGEKVGKASALKMCFAAYSKGTRALLCAILAVADLYGARGELQQQWSRNDSDFSEKAVEKVKGATAKAWRYI